MYQQNDQALIDPTRTTLWMGDLESWMDENYLKIIRDKTSGSLVGYCFLDFGNAFAAAKYLQQLNGTMIPGTNKPFKLNWAAGGTGVGTVNQGDFAVFVGDLGMEVTDLMLFQLFQNRYPSVRSARIVTDAATSLSKGYGFVRFADEGESLRSLGELNGMFVGSRAIRVSTAQNKTTPSGSRAISALSSLPPSHQIAGSEHFNTTIFVGGFDNFLNEDELRNQFLPFGDIVSVKIPAGKGYGFIQFYYHQAAELAIQRMNGAIVNNTRVKVSWGHSASTPIPIMPTAQPLQRGGAPVPQHQQQRIQQQSQVHHYDPLRFLAPEEARQRAFKEMEHILEQTELAKENQPSRPLYI